LTSSLRPARRAARGGALAAAVLGLAVAACRRAPLAEADLIVGGVRLVDRADAGAIAIAAGTVLVAGSPATAEKHAGERTRRIDLGGVTLAPGTRAAMARPFETGERLLNETTGGANWLDLRDSESEEDAVQRVRQVARAIGPGGFILGAGWNETRWIDVHLPDDRLISDIVASNPVLLVRAGGAAGWANHKALEGAGLGHLHAAVTGDDLLKVLRSAPAMSVEERAAVLEAALAAAAARGVTELAARATGGRLGVDDPGASGSVVLDPWRLLAEKGRLPVRVDLMLPAPSAAANDLLARGPEVHPGGGRLTVATLLVDAAGEGAADWVGRAARAGFGVALLVRDPVSAQAAVGLLQGGRAARADLQARFIVAAGADPGAAGRDAMRRAGAPILPEFAGADDAPPIAIPADAGWLREGAPADFLVVGRDATTGGAALDATWVGGVEVYRRAAPAAPAAPPVPGS
jgi:predicted amidohydrolase YtcJ